MADDRNPQTGGGGLQRWTFDGTTWTLTATFNQIDDGSGPILRSFRRLTGYVSGNSITLIAITATAGAGNTVSVFVDDGTTVPVGKTLATAAANTVYRGVALGLMRPRL